MAIVEFNSDDHLAMVISFFLSKEGFSNWRRHYNMIREGDHITIILYSGRQTHI